MTATKNQIREWLEQAKRKKAKYMLVFCDKFSYEDYPVNCKSATEVHKELSNMDNMTGVMECYNLSLDIGKQLEEERTWHIPDLPQAADLAIS